MAPVPRLPRISGVRRPALWHGVGDGVAARAGVARGDAEREPRHRGDAGGDRPRACAGGERGAGDAEADLSGGGWGGGRVGVGGERGRFGEEHRGAFGDELVEG